MSNNFFDLYGKICTEEQLYRISTNNFIKSIIERISQIELIYKAISYILQHDYNWVISLERFLKNIINYRDLVEDIDVKKIDNELIQLFVEVVSDSDNYFEIYTYSDLINYKTKKNEICLSILSSKLDDVPDYALKNFSKKCLNDYEAIEYLYGINFNDIKTLLKKDIDDILKLQIGDFAKNIKSIKDGLYKFALLEYKFGISLEDAETLLNRYGTDIDELPAGILRNYLELLNEIVYCDNIQEVITFAIENNQLKEPWKGFPNAREAEGKILDLFAELYNQTLYKPIPEDKEDYLESYTDPDGNQYDIKVYKVKKDFRMDVRVEGTFNNYNLSKDDNTDYAQYYNSNIIKFHGNSESYIGNANIAIAESETTDIIIGYEKIYPNQLAGASPKVDSLTNFGGIITLYKGAYFSIFGVDNICLRTPNNMINNTRIAGKAHSNEKKQEDVIVNFNEVFKDRIIKNDDGKKDVYKPSYIVWIENDTEEERKNPEWKKNREKDKRWLHTKQAAAQLGVPIVIIDREYFAKRELKKAELMKSLITEEEIDEDKYSEFIGYYKKLTKQDIIKQLFTTIENNRTGMINWSTSYFNNDYRIQIRSALLDATSKMAKEDAIICLNALLEISYKEKFLSVDASFSGVDSSILEFYTETIRLVEDKLNEFGQNIKDKPLILDSKIKENLLQAYFSSEISKYDVNSCSIIPDSNQPTQEGTSK